MAAISAEDILDDLLAAIMLEIHIDIRWLVAFTGKKPLEQHIHPRRINFGNAQGKAHS